MGPSSDAPFTHPVAFHKGTGSLSLTALFYYVLKMRLGSLLLISPFLRSGGSFVGDRKGKNWQKGKVVWQGT